MPRARRRPKSDAELWKQVSKWKPGFTGKQARARLGQTQWRRARSLAVERGQLAASKEVTKRHRTRVRYAVETVPRAGAPRKGLERTQPEEHGWMRATVKFYVYLAGPATGRDSGSTWEIEFSNAIVPIGLTGAEPVMVDRRRRMVEPVIRYVRRTDPAFAANLEQYRLWDGETAMEDAEPVRKQDAIEWKSATVRIFRPRSRGKRTWSKSYPGGQVRG